MLSLFLVSVVVVGLVSGDCSEKDCRLWDGHRGAGFTDLLVKCARKTLGDGSKSAKCLVEETDNRVSDSCY